MVFSLKDVTSFLVLPFMRRFWGDHGDGDDGDPPETEVIGLNSSQRGRDLQFEVKQLQDANQEPTAIFQSEEYLTVVYARKPILKADNSIVVACEESERLVSLDEHKSNTTESDDETFHTDCEELDRSKLPELEPNLNSDDDTLYTAPKGADPSFYPESSEGHKVELGYKDYNYDDADEETELIRPDTSFEVPKKESKRPNTESTSVSGIRRINAKPQFLQMEDGTVEKNSKAAGLLSPYFSTPINLASLDCRHTSFNMSPIHSKSSAEPKVEVFPNPSNLGREVVENSAEFRTGVKRRLDESPKKWNGNKQKLGPKVIFSSFPSKTKADLIQNNFDFSFDETSSVVSSRVSKGSETNDLQGHRFQSSNEFRTVYDSSMPELPTKANKSPGSVYNLTRGAIGDNDDEGKFRRPQTPNSLKRNPIRKRRVRLNQLDVSTPEYPDAYDEDEEKDRDFSTRFDLDESSVGLNSSRVNFSRQEVEAIIRGVRKYGHDFRTILYAYSNEFHPKRTPVSLYNKWRRSINLSPNKKNYLNMTN